MSNLLTVYGFGNRGRDVVDQLVAYGYDVAMIFDMAPRAADYRGIPVRSLHDVEGRALARGGRCVVALHNSYVDIHKIDASLRALQITPISLVNANRFGLRVKVPNGYWLDRASPSFDITQDDAAWMNEILADDTSRSTFAALKRYRETGEISDCPFPSVKDEYVPKDLPRYAEPMHLLDCGAYTGTTYRRFVKSYVVKRYLAFEPDATSFSELSSSKFVSADVTLLPLGVWHRTEMLRFQNGKDMGSNIDSGGETQIQCVAVDEVARTFDANVVKLDVEGAEMQALLGMRHLISRCRPCLCVSVYHRPEDLISIPRILAQWGLDYRFYLRTHEYNAFGTVLYARPF